MKIVLYLILIVSIVTCSGRGQVKTSDNTLAPAAELSTVSVKISAPREMAPRLIPRLYRTRLNMLPQMAAV